VRDQQISRKQALERLEKEEKIPEKIIQNILSDFGLDFFAFQGALRKARRNYSVGIIR
jgi:hypothetical protein